MIFQFSHESLKSPFSHENLKIFNFFFSKIADIHLGGPLIREKDGTLIGVINSGIADQEITGVDDIYVQVNADIRYYFDWISETTGLDMPKC